MGTNIFGVFSCAGSFQSRWTSSAPIHHVTSEEEGCRPSEPLDSLIGGVRVRVTVSYCGADSTSKCCVQCNFSAERVRQEATEWSDKGSWFESGLQRPEELNSHLR